MQQGEGDKGILMFKKKDIFFTTLEAMADTILEAVQYFEQHVTNLKDVTQFAKVMKEYETKCDRHVHTILTELNKTFITPIEREDIMALTTSLDDVLDGIEACASRFEMYGVQEPDEYITLFAETFFAAHSKSRKRFTCCPRRSCLLCASLQFISMSWRTKRMTCCVFA